MKEKISLDGLFKRAELVQFDDTAIYIGRGDKQRIVCLKDISSLSKTSTKVNNQYFWEIKFHVKESSEEGYVYFRPNNTLWNRNFPRFHARLTKITPEAVKTRYRWWFF